MNNRPLIFTCIFATICLNSCSTTPAQTSIPGLAQTLAVRTMVATLGISYFATSTPTPFSTIFPEVENRQSHVEMSTTSTPVPSLTPINHYSADYSNGGKCQNQAEFVEDITVNDESEMKSGQRFTKVWLLQNSGTCTWSPDYSLIFTSGDQMEGLSPKGIGVEVLPGDTVEVSIDLVAPKKSNYYQGNWMLQDDEGIVFGAGNSKFNFFWVSIIVGTDKKFNGIFRGMCGGGG